jgi:hypothetical protein
MRWNKIKQNENKIYNKINRKKEKILLPNENGTIQVLPEWASLRI